MRIKKDELELAKIWCLHNNIKVYAVPINNTTLKIEINNNGVIILGTKTYSSSGGKAKDDKWWLEMDKVYLAYFRKRAKKQ